jgi:ribosomal protein S18 acetylase RimI-like enzyme
MVDFIIKELDRSLLKDISRINNEFDIDSKLVVSLENDCLTCTTIGVPHRTRRVSQDEYDYTTYPDDPEKTAFLAYVSGRVAGELVMRKNWNKFALVEWIGVDRDFRRMGIGRALVSRALQWAKDKNLSGLMLETQDTNVGACRFYQSCGFVLKGFDTGLYAASQTNYDNIALYWYLSFDSLS